MQTIDADARAQHVPWSAMTMNPLVTLEPSQLVAAGARVLARALRTPAALGRSLSRLGSELVDVAAGTSERTPDPADRRFVDPAFRDSAVYRRVMQGYLAWRHWLHQLIDDVDLDPKSRERGRFALTL